LSYAPKGIGHGLEATMTQATNAPLEPRISDETLNFLTHALGFALSLVGSVVLILAARAYGDFWQILGCAIYGACLIALYAASTLSHSFEQPKARSFFRMLDQVCIFLLIAGTYTPFALAFMRDGWLWVVLLMMWLLAAVGIMFKLLFRRLDNVATFFYVAMGWMPVFAVRPIMDRVPGDALLLLLLGGVLYTVGTLFLHRDERVRYFHALWHLFVLAASACHYLAVILFVIPWPAT